MLDANAVEAEGVHAWLFGVVGKRSNEVVAGFDGFTAFHAKFHVKKENAERFIKFEVIEDKKIILYKLDFISVTHGTGHYCTETERQKLG